MSTLIFRRRAESLASNIAPMSKTVAADDDGFQTPAPAFLAPPLKLIR